MDQNEIGMTFATDAEIPAAISSDADDSSIVVGTPSGSQREPKNITVYANNITPIQYGGDDPIVAFDVSFSVGVVCEGGETKTYQIIKRIGIDRLKIAAEAEATVPVSIVEAVKPEAKKKGLYTTEQFRLLAGLK